MDKLDFLVTLFIVNSVAIVAGSAELNSKIKGTYLVVGAGASGLASVEALLENGVAANKIFVIDEALKPGGKISSISLGPKNLFFEQGSQMIIPGAYPHVEKMANALGVMTADLPRGFAIDVKTGGQGTLIPADQFSELGKQIGRYLQLYSEKWHQESQESKGKNYRLLDNDGMAFPHPDLLNKSWYQFVKENNLELLDKALLTLLGGTGNSFESVNTTAAAKVVRAINPDLIKSLFIDKKPVKTFPHHGFQELMVKWFQKLQEQGVHFKLGARAVSIDIGKVTKLTSVQLENGVSTTFQTENIIYAADPTKIATIVKESASLGLNIFEKVQSNDYRVFHYEVQGLEILKGKAGSFALLPTILGGELPLAPFPLGEPIMIVKPYLESDIVMISAHGGENISDEYIEKKIELMLKALNATGSKLDAKKWGNYRYKFPVLNHEKFISAALDLQGKNGFTVVGEALSFGGVESVIDFAKNTIKKQIRTSRTNKCRSLFSK